MSGPAEPLGAKKAKEAKEVGPDVPVAAPEIYTGILGEITMAAEPGTEADPVGVLGSLLTMTSVAVGIVPHVQVGNDRHPLLIWTLLFGRTGSGRKGGATGTAALFASTASPDFASYATSGLSSGEGLIERLRDGDGKDDQGVTDKRLLAVETEFGTVMARAARDGSTLAEVCRQAWNGEALSVLNRKRLSASWSHVGIIGHIAPRDFRRRLAAADLAAGTYNRYLPLYVERSKRLPIPEGADLAVVKRLGEYLAGRIGGARKIRRLQLDREAAALWCDELYEEFTAADDEEQAWAEFMRRAAPYCLRIGGLYAALDGRALIGKADLTAAGALVRYSTASARYVLGSQLRDPRLERLTRAITAAGEAGLTRTEISGLFDRHLPRGLLDDLLAGLVGGGDYEVIGRVQSGGRPAKAYRRRRRPLFRFFRFFRTTGRQETPPMTRLKNADGQPLGRPALGGWMYTGGELLDAVLPPSDWGPWCLDTTAWVLHARGYEVDLERSLTSAQVLDHIMQVADKRWADDTTIAGLVRALGDVLGPQASLCPGGASKRLTKARIRRLAQQAGESRQRALATYPRGASS